MENDRPQSLDYGRTQPRDETTVDAWVSFWAGEGCWVCVAAAWVAGRGFLDSDFADGVLSLALCGCLVFSATGLVYGVSALRRNRLKRVAVAGFTLSALPYLIWAAFYLGRH